MKNRIKMCAGITGGILLSLLMAGTVFAEEYEFDAIDYAITGYLGNGGDLVIPDIIQECPVEIISSSTFYANAAVESLLFPETLITLEGSNIYMMEALNSVTLPESLVIIDAYNFYSCPNVTEVTIPARVSYIGDNSFSDCINLKEIRFKGEVPVIGPGCFEYLSEDVIIYVPEDQIAAYTEALPEGINIQSTGEKSVACDFTASEEEFEFDAETGTVLAYYGFGSRVDIPPYIGGVPVTAIGPNAFYNHRYLYYVTIPEGVIDIEDSAFDSTYHLSWVEFPSALKNIGHSAFGSYRGSSIEFPEGLEHIGEEAFHYAALYNGIHLPEGLKTVGDRAFYNCSASEAYFPSTIESIGEEAFVDSNVYYLCFEGKELPQISESAFNGLNITDVDINWEASREQMDEVQAACDNLGMSARVWRMQNPNVDYIRDGLDLYENGVLISYTGSQSHVRPWDSYEEYDVTALGEGAFKGNKNLEYFAVPYNDLFTTIGKEAFADSSVQTVDLFDSVTTIEEGAFKSCTELTSIVLPESVTSIGAGAFADCIALTELVLPENITEIGEAVFAGCTELKRLVLPASPDYMSAEAFAGVDTVILRINNEATDEQVDTWNEKLGTPWYDPVERDSEYQTVIEMPYEETAPQDFWYDSDFMRLDNYDGYELNLYLPRSIDDVAMDMISANVLSRAKNTWEEVTLPVKSVVIPETAKELVTEAFCDCPDLEVVICYAPLEAIPYNAFANCTGLKQVVFVNGVRNIEDGAFYNCPALETVYLGNNTDMISETAFDGGFDGFVTELPNIDAILEAVKTEPLPIPETEAETPIPALDAEAAADYLGVWNGVCMGMDGTEVALEELGMTVELSMNADGTAVMDIAGDIGAMNWCVTDGIAYVGTCLEDASEVTIREDGMLSLDDGDMILILQRGEADGGMTGASAVSEEAENSE